MLALAVQDVDCLDRVKFRIALENPLTDDFLAQFETDEITMRPFSKMIKGARDLVTVRRANEYQLEAAIGDNSLICSFCGDPDLWPQPALDKMALRLSLAGLGTVIYTRPAPPDCASCAMGRTKQCARSRVTAG